MSQELRFEAIKSSYLTRNTCSICGGVIEKDEVLFEMVKPDVGFVCRTCAKGTEAGRRASLLRFAAEHDAIAAALRVDATRLIPNPDWERYERLVSECEQ